MILMHVPVPSACGRSFAVMVWNTKIQTQTLNQPNSADYYYHYYYFYSAASLKGMPPILTDDPAACSVCMLVCLSHSCTLLKPLDGMRCYLIWTPLWSQITLHWIGARSPSPRTKTGSFQRAARVLKFSRVV